MLLSLEYKVHPFTLWLVLKRKKGKINMQFKLYITLLGKNVDF